jgi:hypothetical protein
MEGIGGRNMEIVWINSLLIRSLLMTQHQSTTQPPDLLNYSLDVSPAQKQYDTFLRNLKSVLNDKANDAIRKFNCIAEGGKIYI